MSALCSAIHASFCSRRIAATRQVIALSFGNMSTTSGWTLPCDLSPLRLVLSDALAVFPRDLAITDGGEYACEEGRRVETTAVS